MNSQGYTQQQGPAQPKSKKLPINAKYLAFIAAAIAIILFFVIKKDGQLSDWSAWSTCDKSCGDGTQFRTRTYIPPVHFGSDLQDKDKLKETQKCNQGPCTNWAGYKYSDIAVNNKFRCGPNFNNTACPDNLCCSIRGHCGSDGLYCAKVGTPEASWAGSINDGIFNDTRPSYNV
jgi:hypothetical protein